MMTLLKSFGTSSQPMLMSELVTHASAEKCGDLLKVRKPTQGALHKGATLIIMVLFFLKHSTNLLWLGTSTTPFQSLSIWRRVP